MLLPPRPSPRVKSPPWIMKPLMTRCIADPRYPNPNWPLTSAAKFVAVFGVTSPNSPIFTRPMGLPLMLKSRNAVAVCLGDVPAPMPMSRAASLGAHSRPSASRHTAPLKAAITHRGETKRLERTRPQGKKGRRGEKSRQRFPYIFPTFSPSSPPFPPGEGVRNLRIFSQTCRHGDADAPSSCLSVGCFK